MASKKEKLHKNSKEVVYIRDVPKIYYEICYKQAKTQTQKKQ